MADTKSIRHIATKFSQWVVKCLVHREGKFHEVLIRRKKVVDKMLKGKREFSALTVI